jgi:DNA invertase Pin-like site-specific DNA recombinase
MRAIGYFRETRGQSLAEQSEAFIAFCKGNGYEAAAAFLDGKSETKADGDAVAGFRQLVDFTRSQASRGFLVVVVANLGSLGGSITEAARRYFQLATIGVPIISIETGEDVSAPLLEKWSEHRAAGSLGDKVKAAMRRRAIKGEALGRPPYGYKVGPKRRLVVVSEEAPSSATSSACISRWSRHPPHRAPAERGGTSDETVGPLEHGHRADILRNRAYVGTYSRFGVRVPASHAPLISQEDFQRVQEQLDQRRPAAESRNISPFLLSGVTYCGYCGNKMIGVTRKQKWKRRSDGTTRSAQYRYYQCESRTNRSLCDYHTKRAEELEAEVRVRLLAAKPGSRPKQSSNGDARGSDEDVRRLRDKARRLDKRLEQYMDDAAMGNINRENCALGLALASSNSRSGPHRGVESRRPAAASDSDRRSRRELLLDRLRDEWTNLLSPISRNCWGHRLADRRQRRWHRDNPEAVASLGWRQVDRVRRWGLPRQSGRPQSVRWFTTRRDVKSTPSPAG